MTILQRLAAVRLDTLVRKRVFRTATLAERIEALQLYIAGKCG